MIPRAITSELVLWAEKATRKPLIIRGARQVGKTTLIHQFANRFDQYIYLNLELPEERELFEEFTGIEDLIQKIFFFKNKSLQLAKDTLIFIDEIQEVPQAFNTLRYFYEQAPHIYVIAAGSLLESLFKEDTRFPVGRVEYIWVRPVSFPEFLDALGENAALERLRQIPFPDFAHPKLLKLYRTYALIGGMPEVVYQYAQHRDLIALGSLFESLLVSYLEDVDKYAHTPSQAEIIRHAIRASYAEAGNRIKFQGFGSSNYGSREMGEALRTLEKALLIQLIYPHTQAQLPVIPDLKKSPRLQVLDTGLLNYFVGIQKDILGSENLHKVYQGKLIEHLTGQELLATQFNPLSRLNFWVREKKSSEAELDFTYTFEGKLIPIEVKAGATGKLKSLHMYMDMAPHNMAIRFYSKEVRINQITTPTGTSYSLLNLPHYLVSQIEAYMNWFQEANG